MKNTKKILIFGFVFFLIFQFFCFYKIIFFDDSKSPGIFFLTDRNGKIITDKANAFGYKKTGEIDFESKFVKSLILIEDKNYFSHFGVNILAKLRAINSNISSSEIVSGGSTITEQFLKNTYFLGEKRTYLQKIKEANLAFFFSVFQSKEKILKNYLENIYFGNNIYGIESAIETYFGKTELQDLTDEEITILISLIRHPSVTNLNDKNFKRIFEEIKNKLNFDFKRTIFDLNKKKNIDNFPFVTNKFCENEKINCIGKTSIDLELQNFSKNILGKTLKSLKGKNVTNAAVLAINPENMEVLVYLGSADFYNKNIDGQVDMLSSALRQPGSTMKPFLYLQALEKGANPNDFLVDIKSNYDSFSDDETYFSENYSLKEYGLQRLKKSLGNSLNNATVRLAKEIGLEKVFDFYKKYGIKFLENNFEFYGYSLVLGNNSMTLENLALSYINLIPDFEINNSRKLNFSINSQTEKTVNIDENKFLLYEILKNPDNRGISFGVNSILNTSIFQAVKTGTSSNFKDNLVISYDKNFLLLVWVGNSDNSSMKGVTGITGAGYVWHQIIEKAISDGYIKNTNYKIPKNIEKTQYCLDKNCFRKENSYEKIGKKYFSAILDNYFSHKDMFIKISKMEKIKLKDLGFEIE